MIEWLFWLTFLTLAYIYAGYPALVYIGSRVFTRKVQKRPYEPTVTIIIAAYNERAHIGATLANKLALDYPKEKLQIIVVSDGSDDGTDEVAREFQKDGVVLLRQEPRNGKTAALNVAVGHALGELLVFSDANSLYEPTALRRLAENFADPRVGYVTGMLGYLNPDGSMTGDGCSIYMRYENFIRRCETLIGSIVGVNGGIDAVRRELYRPMKPDDLPDLVLPLQVASRGYRVVYEPSARLNEFANTNPESEYRMRVRVSLRALWTLAEMPGIMSIRRQGFYAVQVFSHKVLRYLAFVFIIALFVFSALLLPAGPVYSVAFALQLAFIVTAAAGFIAERRHHPSRFFSVPYYFLLVNAAASHACWKFVKGERHRMWRPRLG
jgi:cellulose synthase/poly-beta-1,6-N-acetylglucosamine synthase-like glycosyltransferase